MVAHNGIDAVTGFQTFEDWYERLQLGGIEIDQVAGEDDEVGLTGVDTVDDTADESGVAGVGAQMKVGEVDDTIAVERFGQRGKG